MKKNYLHWAFTAIISTIALLLLCSFIFRMFVSTHVDPTVAEQSGRSFEEVIQVNILNGCGVPKLAAETKLFLQSRGFDVVEIGNSSGKQLKSVVLDRVGDIKSAFKVAVALGINDSLVTAKLDSNQYLNCTVIIGEDFKTLNPFN